MRQNYRYPRLLCGGAMSDTLWCRPTNRLLAFDCHCVGQAASALGTLRISAVDVIVAVAAVAMSPPMAAANDVESTQPIVGADVRLFRLGYESPERCSHASTPECTDHSRSGMSSSSRCMKSHRPARRILLEGSIQWTVAVGCLRDRSANNDRCADRNPLPMECSRNGAKLKAAPTRAMGVSL